MPPNKTKGPFLCLALPLIWLADLKYCAKQIDAAEDLVFAFVTCLFFFTVYIYLVNIFVGDARLNVVA